jgi:hypothetical protein
MYELWNYDEEFVWLWEVVLSGFKGCDMLGMASAQGHDRGCRRQACAMAKGQENPQTVIQKAELCVE